MTHIGSTGWLWLDHIRLLLDIINTSLVWNWLSCVEGTEKCNAVNVLFRCFNLSCLPINLFQFINGQTSFIHLSPNVNLILNLFTTENIVSKASPYTFWCQWQKYIFLQILIAHSNTTKPNARKLLLGSGTEATIKFFNLFIFPVWQSNSISVLGLELYPWAKQSHFRADVYRHAICASMKFDITYFIVVIQVGLFTFKPSLVPKTHDKPWFPNGNCTSCLRLMYLLILFLTYRSQSAQLSLSPLHLWMFFCQRTRTTLMSLWPLLSLKNPLHWTSTTGSTTAHAMVRHSSKLHKGKTSLSFEL